METKKCIKITVEQGVKTPKKINDSGAIFLIHMPKRIQIKPGRNTEAKM